MTEGGATAAMVGVRPVWSRDAVLVAALGAIAVVTYAPAVVATHWARATLLALGALLGAVGLAFALLRPRFGLRAATLSCAGALTAPLVVLGAWRQPEALADAAVVAAAVVTLAVGVAAARPRELRGAVVLAAAAAWLTGVAGAAFFFGPTLIWLRRRSGARTVDVAVPLALTAAVAAAWLGPARDRGSAAPDVATGSLPFLGHLLVATLPLCLWTFTEHRGRGAREALPSPGQLVLRSCTGAIVGVMLLGPLAGRLRAPFAPLAAALLFAFAVGPGVASFTRVARPLQRWQRTLPLGAALALALAAVARRALGGGAAVAARELAFAVLLLPLAAFASWRRWALVAAALAAPIVAAWCFAGPPWPTMAGGGR
ncbi:MAG: hypothetical protein IPM29_02205 [Planctomycetes bacterium]|nr:hypothetical protein [Planctomycetota bacterium]